MLCIQKKKIVVIQTFLCVKCSYLTLRPSFVTGDERSQSDWRRTGTGTTSVSNGIAGLYWSYSMPCIQKKAIAALPTIILLLHVQFCHKGHHLSLVMNGVTKWLKKGRYGYQQNVRWYSWSIFIMIHALSSEIGHYCNAHDYVADTCSYLSQRPSFVSFDECSRGYYWSSICVVMGTGKVAKGIAGLCVWDFMLCIQKEADDAMLSNILMLHFLYICYSGHHL
jgi:hypothetical protein